MHFARDMIRIGGKTLAESAGENGICGARKELLLWHFRQCVFANMRGAGEPKWDYGDDEPGERIAQIMKEDASGHRLYLELAHRLAQVIISAKKRPRPASRGPSKVELES
jgi:hypothetical protein